MVLLFEGCLDIVFLIVFVAVVISFVCYFVGYFVAVALLLCEFDFNDVCWLDLACLVY